MLRPLPLVAMVAGAGFEPTTVGYIPQASLQATPCRDDLD